MNNQSPNNGNNNNNKRNANGQMILLFLLITLAALFFMSMFSRWQRDMTTKEISYTEFLKMVEEDKVDEVHVTSNSYRITPKKSENEFVTITYFTGIAGNDLELVALLKKHGVEYYPYIPDDSATWVYNILSIVLPILLLWAVMGFLMRKMGNGMGMGVGKNTAKVYVEKKTGVTFKDVAGQDEAKESLQEVVDFLHNPQKYTDIGAKLPKGALLVGPPGTGKTLLAKAVAGEANVPFFSLAGSDFVEMFVGVGASRVRDLFKEAQKQAPCIIFIDEIDAIGKSRDTRYGSGNDEREQTLNQLLAEMDGFDTSKGLLILAATNRPEVLDKALLRPGRFDRRIIVEKPDLKGRVETLKVHSKDVLMDETVDLDAIALATSGAVGSDLANMINEAAINAVKNGRKYVNQSDLFESVEVVIAGKEKKDRILGEEEKRVVAYHEVGHALTTALQKNAEPVQKITIVPRTMGALGYVMQAPEEEKYLMTEEELKARLVTFMAGRAAEEIVFHSITTGASNDIEKATQIARAMVTQYGMSKKFGLISLESVENRYLDGRPVLNCGDHTAAEIDQEVQVLLKESYETARRLLEENRDVLDKIAEHLFEHETITGKEFMRIYRELKGIPQPPEEEASDKTGGKKHPVNLPGTAPGQPGGVQNAPMPGQAGGMQNIPGRPGGMQNPAVSGQPGGAQNASIPGQPGGMQNIPGQPGGAQNASIPGQPGSMQNIPGQPGSTQNGWMPDRSGGMQNPGQAAGVQNKNMSGQPGGIQNGWPDQSGGMQNIPGQPGGIQNPGMSGRSAGVQNIPGQPGGAQNVWMPNQTGSTQNVSGQPDSAWNGSLPGQPGGTQNGRMPDQAGGIQNVPGRPGSTQNAFAPGQPGGMQQVPGQKTGSMQRIPGQPGGSQNMQNASVPGQPGGSQNMQNAGMPGSTQNVSDDQAGDVQNKSLQNEPGTAQHTQRPGQQVQNRQEPGQMSVPSDNESEKRPGTGSDAVRQRSDWEQQLWKQDGSEGK